MEFFKNKNGTLARQKGNFHISVHDFHVFPLSLGSVWILYCMAFLPVLVLTKLIRYVFVPVVYEKKRIPQRAGQSIGPSDHPFGCGHSSVQTAQRPRKTKRLLFKLKRLAATRGTAKIEEKQQRRNGAKRTDDEQHEGSRRKCIVVIGTETMRCGCHVWSEEGR